MSEKKVKAKSSKYEKYQDVVKKSHKEWLKSINKKTINSPVNLSLKHKSLKTVISDASNDEFLSIVLLIKQEMMNRSQIVEIVLFSFDNFNGIFDHSPELYNELHRIGLTRYVKQNYPTFDNEEQTALIKRGVYILDPFDLESNPHAHIKYRREYERLENQQREIRYLVAFTDREDDKFVEEIEELSETGYFDKYFERSSENKYIIRALHNLEKKGILTDGIMLYELQVPLGTSYKIYKLDGKDIPVIVW